MGQKVKKSVERYILSVYVMSLVPILLPLPSSPMPGGGTAAPLCPPPESSSIFANLHFHLGKVWVDQDRDPCHPSRATEAADGRPRQRTSMLGVRTSRYSSSNRDFVLSHPEPPPLSLFSFFNSSSLPQKLPATGSNRQP